MSLFKIAAGVGSLISIGGLGFFGVHEGTKKTISYELGEKKIPKFEEGDFSKIVWSLLFNKLKNTSGKGEKPKTEYFNNFESNLKKDNDNSEELKNFCEKSSREIYSTIFKTNQNLMDDVKSFCTIKIGDVGVGNLLEASESKREGNKSHFEKYLSELKSHDSVKYGNLVEDLEKLKKDNTEDRWKKLAGWCEKSYELFFFDDEEPIWKQVEKYCKKPFSVIK